MLLWSWPETEFKRTLRVQKETFRYIEMLIKDDPVFKNYSKNTQTEVWIQLATALERIGYDGNGACIRRISSISL